ncbi:MAG: WD40 repeat domain-containing protein [Cyanobacteria bacterium P01_D01_bin.105]
MHKKHLKKNYPLQKNDANDSPDNHHPRSYQHNPKSRNLFPLVALLVAAGSTIALISLILNLADTIGGAPRPITTVSDTGPSVTSRDTQPTQRASASSVSAGANTLSANAAAPAALPRATVLGNHSASVVSIVTPQTPRSTQVTRSGNPLVITGGHDNTVRVWTTQAGSNPSPSEPVVHSRLVHNSHVNDLALVPNLRANSGTNSPAASAPLRLVTGSGSGEIKLWALDANQLITTIADNAGRILSVAANADGSLLASGSSNGTLKVWPVKAIATQKSQTNLRGQILKVTGPDLTALQFHPTDPNRLISGNQVGTLHVWDIARQQIKLTLASSSPSAINLEPTLEPQNTLQITDLAITSDGRYVASSSNSGLIHIWDLETGRLTQTLSGHRSAATDVAFSTDNQVLASSSRDQTIKIWNWAEGDINCTLSDQTGPIGAIAFTNNGDTLISGSNDGAVKAWNLSQNSNRACIDQ